MITRFKDPSAEWQEADHVATIGVDFVKKVIDCMGKRILVQTWDTAGQERFRSITSAYFRGSQGAIVCYDCTEPSTLLSAKSWIEEYRQKSAQDTPIILVACKADLLDRPLPTEAMTVEQDSEVIDIPLIAQSNADNEEELKERGISLISQNSADTIENGRRMAA